VINKFVPFFKKIFPPSFYTIIRGWYWKIRQLTASLCGERKMEKMWASRPRDEITKGFSNLSHPQRGLIVERISAFQPISGILEIGCGYGPNLYWLAKQFPESELVGIDINPLSIEEGHRFLMESGAFNVKLIHGKADELQQFIDKSFDIVFTNALLIYIAPDKINKVIGEMFRIARRALVLTEWHYENATEDPYGLGIYHFGHWKRNYINLLEQFIPRNKIHVTKIPEEIWPVKEWKELGYIIEAII